jgi:sulfatase modifying factor 1
LPLIEHALPLPTLALALGLAGCVDDEHAPRTRVPIKPERTEAAPIECRFDPVTLASETKASAPTVCYTPTQPEQWWEKYAAPLPEPPPPPQALDAGPPPPPPACPPEMVLIEGLYCPDVRQKCLAYLDEKSAFLAHNRCKEFDRHPECKAERELLRFCIDRDEYVPAGGELPLSDQSWTMSQELCESQGKRLCFESEWQFACEGESLLPYPYGFERNSKICNFDLTNLEDKRTGKLLDKRVRPRDRPTCTSPFGVRNMVGNMDEWTRRDGMMKPYRAALHGGWWLAGRNNCRAATTGHDEFYFGLQTGVRCCKPAR